MSPIQHAINEAIFTISKPLLREAFRDTVPNYGEAPISLDEQIRRKVIYPRVMVNMNLIAPREISIPISDLVPEILPDFSIIYQIPPERVNNSVIISVLNVSYIPVYGFSSIPMSGSGIGQAGLVNNPLLAKADRVDNSVENIPVTNNANVDIVGVNRIRIREVPRNIPIHFLTCLIENDRELNNLKPGAYLNFSLMACLAIKSYIYTKLNTLVDKAFLEGGQELGTFRSELDTYSSAEAEYQTFLREKWGKTANMGDSAKKTRLLRAMFPTNI